MVQTSVPPPLTRDTKDSHEKWARNWLIRGADRKWVYIENMTGEGWKGSDVLIAHRDHQGREKSAQRGPRDHDERSKN